MFWKEIAVQGQMSNDNKSKFEVLKSLNKSEGLNVVTPTTNQIPTDFKHGNSEGA
jgi:hypothetical protein